MTTDELPVHPRTGLTALGVLDSGRIVWPALGGAPDDQDEDQDDDAGDGQDQDGDADEDADSGDQDDGADAGDEEDPPLGPKGVKALQAEKARRKEETRKRRAAEAELAKLRNGDGDEATQAQRDAEQAATAKANQRILKAEIKAAAAGKLADPADAFRFLQLDQFEVGEDGDVDEDEIAEAIDDLIKRKPYLAAAAQGAGRRFQGGADQGARKKTKGPTLDEQIAEAEKNRDFARAISLKRERAAVLAEQKTT